jgi:two-component system LytT family response regulator
MAHASAERDFNVSPLRAFIVDDEPIARAGLRNLLATDPDIEIAGECGDGQSAVDMIVGSRPDIVFLDVQMPDVDGFDVLRALDREQVPVVVFVTAYDRYAVKAFEVHAVEYLLKPFDDARFFEALSHAKTTARERRQGAVTERLAALLASAEQRTPLRSRFLIRTGGRVLFLRADAIDWIEAADYYVKLHVAGKVHMLRETLTALESRLDPAMFFRVHRSAIVNLERVRELQPFSKREHVLILQDGTRLRLTRSRRDGLEAMLGQRL